MKAPSDWEIVLGVVCILFAILTIALIVYKLVRYGFKGALFNGRTESTVGEVAARDFEVGTTTFRVHLLRNDRGRFVGIERRRSDVGELTIEGHAMSADEARALGDALLRTRKFSG